MNMYIKVSSYIAQYPILRIAQSALQFTSQADLFNQTPSELLWEASNHMLHLMRDVSRTIYPPQSIAIYAFMQLRELEQSSVEKIIQDVYTTAHDWNSGRLSRESEERPLSDYTIQRRFTR